MLSGKARRMIGAVVAAGTVCAGGFALFGSPVSASPGGHGESPAHHVYTDPQSASNADYSGHGANRHGPYDSTRDGSASQNGKGDGKAGGKPCAGCVGKADNKNPRGQMPGGSDHNAGYECDRNQGVGQGNPAHTSCTEGNTSPSDTPTPSETPTTPSQTPTPSETPTTPTETTSPSETPTTPTPSETPTTSSEPSGPVESTGTFGGTLPGSGDAGGAAPLADAPSPATAPIATSPDLADTGARVAVLIVFGAALIGLGTLAISLAARRHRAAH